MIMNDAQKNLAENNRNLVYAAIRRYIGGEYVTNEDMVSDGFLGLCKAAATFDPDRSVMFSTYAVKCILNEITKEFRHRMCKCRGCGDVPVSLNQTYMLSDEFVELLDIIGDENSDTEQEALDPLLIDSISHIAPTIVEMVQCELTPKEMADKYSITRQAIHNRINKERKRLRLSKALPL